MNGLKAMRKRANLTQAELASVLGVKQTTVAMWETAASYPKATLMVQTYTATIFRQPRFVTTLRSAKRSNARLIISPV